MTQPLALSARAGALIGGFILTLFLGLAGSQASSDQKSDDKAAAPEAAKHRNRLAKETSPYLLLHAGNPVDWYPWGPEAFAKAKAESKPIFLSIGYSSCYWCHVMERESFSDAAIAKVLNDHFVCIKVDREERPDVDQVYMSALQAFGNGGGWPMSMFLTPNGRPFFGGTYYPPTDTNGREGFTGLLERVWTAWRDHRPELERDADRTAEFVRRASAIATARGKVALSHALAAAGVSQLAEQFDPMYGGFGFAPDQPRRPKFPEPSNLVFLLDQNHRTASVLLKPSEPLRMVLSTLDHMARGGIRDRLAGGYHRYSTERSWTVPHFEKMLYDNAQLATVHLLAYEATGDVRWRREAESIFAFVARTLTAPEGAFYSSLDAETNGEEGQYYVWSRDEIRKVLASDDDYATFARVYGLERDPNFENSHYVLCEPRPRAEQAKALGVTPEALEARLAPLREKLLAVRDERQAPLRDDKILTSWNGLMIAAYSDAFRLLKDERYRHAAEKAADFVWSTLRTPEGRLLRTYRAGQAKLPAYLEDYALLAHGLLRLHAATGDPKHLARARTLIDRMLADFADRNDGTFFYTAEDHESLLARPKDPFDAALPSGNSVAIRDLIALAAATGEPHYLDQAGRALNTFSPILASNPVAVPLMLTAMEEYLATRPAVEGEPAAPSPEPADAQAVLSAKAALKDPSASVAPGREVEVVLTLTIKDGWHIHANPPSSEILKPTTVTLSTDQANTLTRVEYPRGQLKTLASSGSEKVSVYEGKINLTAHVRLDQAAKAGTAALKFQVRYQACNDRVCLAPASLTVPFEVTVGSR